MATGSIGTANITFTSCIIIQSIHTCGVYLHRKTEKKMQTYNDDRKLMGSEVFYPAEVTPEVNLCNELRR